MNRDVAALRDGTFDLLVLGGGITGAGVALDATLRGFRTALIDKGDFASGTSSVSSKLIHGGVRYLEHGGFHLVYEALHERRRLLENAPHLVHPLRFVIPYYRDARVPAWKWRAGLTLYDLLAGASNLRRSRPLPLARMGSLGLQVGGLYGGCEYFDAQMDDARLCLEVIRTAVREGTQAVNYVEAIAFEKNQGTIVGVRAVDRVAGEELSIRGRLTVNATGPWVDQVCRLAGDDTGPRLQPTKGVHLVVPPRGEPRCVSTPGNEQAEMTSTAFLLLHPRDGRVFFVIPWLGKTLIGTTDTLCEDGPDALRVTPDEVTYLLEGHNHYFTCSLERSDILGSFAGLRPLIRARPDEPSSISREFRLFHSGSGLLSVAGGKYTTYRRMAEVITDALARQLGRYRFGRTRSFPLDGAPPEPWAQFEATETAALSKRDRLSLETARHLVNRYGRHAHRVADYINSDPNLAQPIFPGEPDLNAELAYQRDHEMAVFPADHLLRRTRLGLFHPELLERNITVFRYAR